MIALSLLLSVAAFADVDLNGVRTTSSSRVVVPGSGTATFRLTNTSTSVSTSVETMQKSKITGPSVPSSPPKMPEEPTKPTGFR